MNKDLGLLSTAEELWLWRIRQPMRQIIERPFQRRHRHEMSRREAAKFLGISLERYTHLERGQRVQMAIDEMPALAFLRMERPEMSLREQLWLARRRSGLLIREIAHQIGVSHQTVLSREDNATRSLIDYWASKGFMGWNLPPELQPRPAPPPPPPPSASRPRLRAVSPAPEPEPEPGPRLIEQPRRPARPSLLRKAS